MRFFYSVLFYLAMPLVFVRLLWRSYRLPAYRERFKERLGYQSFKLNQSLWVHAVSVGEVLAAIPLIKALQQRYPSVPILVTTMTPTGYARLRAAMGESVRHAYIPYDLPSAVKRFLTAANPLVAIIMETELWPNLLHGCKKKMIPICLMNARLSNKSAKGYARIKRLTYQMLQNMSMIAAHGQEDAKRFISLGAAPQKVVVTGNIKFDLELPTSLLERAQSLKESFGPERFIWIAASTHEGEEEIILAAHKEICDSVPDALLILTPRHPDRFDRVAKLCEQKFITKRRSKNEQVVQESNIYLADTMGELLLFYALADVAFVGGSLIPQGGHNMLEPAALAKPILTGPHLHNFAEISKLFITENALTIVKDSHHLATHLFELMQDKEARETQGKRALQVMTANRGALAKQLTLLNELPVLRRIG